jgi:ribose transport system permease protein
MLADQRLLASRLGRALTWWSRHLRHYYFANVWFASALLVMLLTVNVVLDPRRFSVGALGTTLGLAAPLILAAIASTPPVLSGGGGIDLSVGPLMGLVNALVVHQAVISWRINSPVVIVAFALVLGVASGLLNGTLTVLLRLQPIVTTLGTYLVYGGLTLWIVPTPSGSVPGWLASLAGAESVVPIAVVLLLWWGLTQLPYYEHLMATGGDDRAAYASGVNVAWVRVGAYVLSGVFAAVAGLSLTALLGSVDPTVGPTYTLIAIAAVALGGVSLAGGRGGMLGAVVGALDIFLMQSILTYFNASSFTLEAAYGAILVLAVILNAALMQLWRRTWTATGVG